jgi:uncharacterized protein (DUF433 family)
MLADLLAEDLDEEVGAAVDDLGRLVAREIQSLEESERSAMTTTAPVDIGSLLSSTPGVQGGKLCIAGTRTRVITIGALAMQGMTAEQIFEDRPHLDLAQIHAALAYYYANKELVEAQLEAEEKLEEELAAKYPNGWTPETNRP